MRTREIADGVHVVTSEGLVNWVLVCTDDGLLAVDAGMRTAWEDLALLCAGLRRDPRDLRAVVLTHGHVDHTGFARRAQDELGSAVHVHPADVRLLEHPLVGSPPERLPLAYVGHAAARRALVAMRRGGALRTPVPHDTVALTPGATLTTLPGAPVVLASPGHTAGHCSVLFPAHGVLVAGDALVTHDPYTGRTGPRLIARGATRSSADARASLDALESVDAAILVPGHGPVWSGGAPAAARAARAEAQA
jgi:glyoxylase-like metal-dependent hydrolase (beta-lactamase superfamily II)